MGSWIVELDDGDGSWRRLCQTDEPLMVGQILRAICEVGDRLPHTVRVRGDDLPLLPKSS